MPQPTPKELERFGNIIVQWSRKNPRPMPWKNFSDPYHIWIAEIILQQTRVDQGSPYFEKFIRFFPDLETLALAAEEEVMIVWEGLGYYSRARNLHHTAKHVWNDLDGQFPDNSTDLQRLKGIGPYTSAAIASFAFGEQIAVVDGNVKRVVSRYFNITDPIDSPDTSRLIQKLVNEAVHYFSSAEFNQAIMNFGALMCIPRKPDCEQCVARSHCKAYIHDNVDRLPMKLRTPIKKERWLNFGVYIRDGRIGLVQNTISNIWKNLYLLPVVGKHSDFKTGLESQEPNPPLRLQLLDEMEWVLSHRRLNLRFYLVNEWPSEWSKVENIQLVELEKISNFALPRPFRLFLNQNSRKLGINKSYD